MLLLMVYGCINDCENVAQFHLRVSEAQGSLRTVNCYFPLKTQLYLGDSTRPVKYDSLVFEVQFMSDTSWNRFYEGNSCIRGQVSSLEQIQSITITANKTFMNRSSGVNLAEHFLISSSNKWEDFRGIISSNRINLFRHSDRLYFRIINPFFTEGKYIFRFDFQIATPNSYRKLSLSYPSVFIRSSSRVMGLNN